jgi:outer membrane protein W
MSRTGIVPATAGDIIMMRLQSAKSTGFAIGLALAASMLAPSLADAQVVQVTRGDSRNAIGFNLGYFALRGEDSRSEDDVLLADLDFLAFEVDDFNGFTFGGEWLYGISDYLETGVGVGYYQHSVTSVYRDFVNADGTEIVQDLKLRVIPITATVRFLPVGRDAVVEPYVGAGIGIFPWRYSETGDFVDFSDDSIFRARYSEDGTAVGPVVLAGLRAPVGDLWSIGGEIRWQHAEGDTKPEQSELLGSKIDLGGWTTSFTVHFRF